MASQNLGPTQPSLDLLDVNHLVRDLLAPKPAVYWSDLLLSAVLGWASFALFTQSLFLWARVGFYFLAVVFLFRCLFFIHELTHHSSHDLPGFHTAWNLLVGIPLIVPSLLYEGVHLDHHRRNKYGTIEDPEYLPLGVESRLKILVFILQTFLFPLAFALRFLILAPIALLIPPVHRWLEVHASALVINSKYKRREMTESERHRLKILELGVLLFWGSFSVFFFAGKLSIRFFTDFYLLIWGVAFVNQLRTLVAHRYANVNGEMTYEAQLFDSVNIEGGLWTEIWAPVGARYHALHHFVPKIPYHSLAEAHKRMKEHFSVIYSQVNERSFLSAIQRLNRSVIENKKGRVENAAFAD